MKSILKIFPLLLITLAFSCKKSDNISKPFAVNASTNSDVASYFKVDLTNMGGGVYQCGDYKGLSIRVTAIHYKSTDDWGNPLPVRTGDPVYGTVQLVSGVAISIAQPDASPQNHFAIQQTTFTTGNGTVDYNMYALEYNKQLDAFNQAFQTWKEEYDKSIQFGGFYTPPAPQFAGVEYTNYFTGNNNIMTTTGKLIRSTTGSTFAVASEDYPLPPPAIPAGQYYVGFWMSGTTKINVFVSGYNHNVINKSSVNVLTNLVPASGTYNASNGTVTNFSMTTTVNGVQKTYTYTGVLQGIA